jgi:hypothetical protein
MYLTVPSEETFDLTSGVRATGEKTAREPVAILTIVPRPPILRWPKRRKGTLRVVMLGVTSRMTMTFAGSEGMSLAADLEVIVDDVGRRFGEAVMLGASSNSEVVGSSSSSG